MRKTLALIAALMASPAFADGSPSQTYAVVHNNSIMSVSQARDGTVAINYDLPKPEMAAIGVVPGMNLVTGRWRDRTFFGQAVVFVPRCNMVAPYAVQGGVNPDTGALELSGPAPVIAPWCGVLGLSWNDNSRLVFWPLREPQS
jgi:hypothetical protein